MNAVWLHLLGQLGVFLLSNHLWLRLFLTFLPAVVQLQYVPQQRRTFLWGFSLGKSFLFFTFSSCCCCHHLQMLDFCTSLYSYSYHNHLLKMSKTYARNVLLKFTPFQICDHFCFIDYCCAQYQHFATMSPPFNLVKSSSINFLLIFPIRWPPAP